MKSSNIYISFVSIMICLMLVMGCGEKKPTIVDLDVDEPTSVQFQADSAFPWIVAQCDFGPRVPGSEAHRKCGDFIKEKFTALHLDVVEQNAQLQMWDGKSFMCRNFIAQYKPEVQQRIVLCTHYDSRPWSDHDANPSLQNEPVMAANDGASGVAVLLEVARHLNELNPEIGIDFVCFDLEDYGAPQGKLGAGDDGSSWCQGSRYWATHPHRDNYSPEFGILLDMVGGKGAKFAREYFSLQYAAPVVARIWSAASTAGYSDYFIDENTGAITDDHLNMNAAGIPTADIISYYGDQGGFGPTWHTTHDTPENIDKATLQAVGQTLLQLIADY